MSADRGSDWRSSPDVSRLPPGLLEALGLRFQIVDLLGAGGNGVVFRAQQIGLDRTVALKICVGDVDADPLATERALFEARSMAAVVHPNLVKIFGVEQVGPTVCLICELIAGTSLAERLRIDTPLPAAEIHQVASEICRGLVALHERGFVHRDLKPANILIDETGTLRIADFGLALGSGRNFHTQPQVLVGTPHYISPEQVAGGEADARSDLYALGIILYETTTGQVPFAGEFLSEVLAAHVRGRPVPIRDLRPDAPRWVVQLAEQLMEKDPAGRPQSASDVLAVLENVATGAPRPVTRLIAREAGRVRPPGERSITPPTRRGSRPGVKPARPQSRPAGPGRGPVESRRSPIIPGALLVLVLIGGVAGVVLHRQRPVILRDLSIQITPGQILLGGILEGPGNFSIGLQHGARPWLDSPSLGEGSGARLSIELPADPPEGVTGPRRIRFRHDDRTLATIPLPWFDDPLTAGALGSLTLRDVEPQFADWTVRVTADDRPLLAELVGEPASRTRRLARARIPDTCKRVVLESLESKGRLSLAGLPGHPPVRCSVTITPRRSLYTRAGLELALSSAVSSRNQPKMSRGRFLSSAFLVDESRVDLLGRLAAGFRAHFGDRTVPVERKLASHEWLSGLGRLLVAGVHNGSVEPCPIEDLAGSYLRFRVAPLPASFRFNEDAARFTTLFPPLGVADERGLNVEAIATGSIGVTFIKDGVLQPEQGCPAALQQLLLMDTWGQTVKLAAPPEKTRPADLVFDACIGNFDRECIYTLRLRGAADRTVEVPIWRQTNDYTSFVPHPGRDSRYDVRSWKNVRWNSCGVQVVVPDEVVSYLGSPLHAELEYAANLLCLVRRDGPGFLLGYDWSWVPAGELEAR